MIIRNAWKSIARAKGRNILIGIIVFVIAVASCISLSIKSAAKDAQDNALESIVITASISPDRTKLMEGMDFGGGRMNQDAMAQMRERMEQYGELELAQLEQYAQADSVKEFYYSNSLSLNASGELEAYGADSSTDSDSSDILPDGVAGRITGGGRGGFSIIGRVAMGDFTVTGYSSKNAMSDFLNGTSKITDGEMFDFEADEKACLISTELAVYNSLSVGESITLQNPNLDDDTETYSLKIAGIYSSSATSGEMPRFGTAMDPANLICVSSKTVDAITAYSQTNAVKETDDEGNETSSALTGSLSGTFSFSSEENFERFQEQVTQMGLSEYYAVNSPDVNNFEASIQPLESLSDMATKLLLVVFAVGAIILIVLNLFNIRERKYEVGVLTAIGIKKRKVAAQFVAELLAVTLVAILLGAAAGAVTSVPVANSLLQSQVEAQQAQQNQQDQNFGGGAMMGAGTQGNVLGQNGGLRGLFGASEQDVNYLDEINATANLTVVLQLIALGLCLTVISSFAAIVFVLRYEPLKILANRA